MAAAPLKREDAVITVAGLRKDYGKTPAVQGVTFAVGAGEVFGLLGPDGAGKSSIMQILTGVLRATAGEVRVAGTDVVAAPELVKPHIGFMPQGLGLNLYDGLSVEENIDFFGDLREVEPEVFQANKEELLGITRLADFRERPAAQLSGGMRQKLALCCTLVHLPALIFLDEPTTGVDPISRRDFWSIINRLVVKRGTTVVLTTSYMDEAERCHRVAFMHQGKIIAMGPTRELQEEARRAGEGGLASLEEAFIRAMAREGGGEAREELAEPAMLAGALGEAGPEAIRVEGLTKTFGRFTAAAAVSFGVGRGEIFGFLGPNGAGKTTVIKMLTGILPPTAGRAFLDGVAVDGGKARLKGRLGYMSQKFSLYRDLTVAENIMLYGGVYGLTKAERQARVPEIVRLADLEGREETLAGSLPLGIRQRLALGCAILHRPRIVFLDEPTSGVDPVARRQFWKIIARLAAAGVSILVSTHYMDEAQHCQRLAFMHQGRLVAVGTPAELREAAEQAVGRRLEVDSPAFGEAFGVLKGHYPAAALHGRRIHLPSRQPAADRGQVREILGAAGLPVEGVTENGLSMEDVFIYFIGRGEKG